MQQDHCRIGEQGEQHEGIRFQQSIHKRFRLLGIAGGKLLHDAAVLEYDND